MTKPLGFIAFDKQGFPVCDSAGHAIVYATMEDAMDADKVFESMQISRRVGKTLRLVKAAPKRARTGRS